MWNFQDFIPHKRRRSSIWSTISAASGEDVAVSFREGLYGFVGSGFEHCHEQEEEMEKQKQHIMGGLLPAIEKELAHQTWYNRVYAGAVEARRAIGSGISLRSS